MRRGSLWITVLLLAFGILLVFSLVGCSGSGGGDDDTDDDIDDDTIDDDTTDDDTEQPPEAPSGLSAIPTKYTMTLTWTDNSDNEDGFIVERGTESKGWEQVADLPADTTSYTDEGLDCEAAYDYRVKAYNDVGDSDYATLDEPATTRDCWSQTFVRDPGYHGFNPSVALDSDGNEHVVAYYSLKLAHFYRTSKGREMEIIDDTQFAGEHNSIAIDGDGNVHVAYTVCTELDENNYCADYDLKYATNSSGEWETYLVDDGDWAGEFCRIGIGSGGMVQIAYAVDEEYVYYAHGSPDDWTIEEVDDSFYWWLDMKLGPSDEPHLAYGYYDESTYDYGTRYAVRSTKDASWTMEHASWDGEFISLALDDSGKAFIALAYDYEEPLEIATNVTGSWQIMYLDYDPLYLEYEDLSETAIAIDSEGFIHAALYSYDTYGLVYTDNASAYWKIESVDEDYYYAVQPAVVLDSGDDVHIAYYWSDYDAPMMAVKSGKGWTTEQLAEPVHWGYMNTKTIVLDSEDRPHIAAVSGGLTHYFMDEDGKWHTEFFFPGKYCYVEDVPMAFYSDDEPCFVVETTDALYLVEKQASSWNVEHVAGSAYVFGLVVDSQDVPHVIYSTGYVDTYHAFREGSSWTTEYIGGLGPVAAAIDSDDVIHIAGSPNNPHDYYAKKTDKGWTIEEFDTCGSMAHSIYVGDSGDVHVVYRCQSSQQLKYAVRSDGSWTKEVVFTEPDYYIGWRMTVVADDSGDVHVLFSDYGRTYYAVKTDGSWSVEDIGLFVSPGSSPGLGLAFDSSGYLHMFYEYDRPYYTLVYRTTADVLFDE